MKLWCLKERTKGSRCIVYYNQIAFLLRTRSDILTLYHWSTLVPRPSSQIQDDPDCTFAFAMLAEQLIVRRTLQLQSVLTNVVATLHLTQD